MQPLLGLPCLALPLLLLRLMLGVVIPRMQSVMFLLVV